MDIDRRRACLSTMMFSLFGGCLSGAAQDAQEPSSPSASAPIAMDTSHVFRFDAMPVISSQNGGWQRPVMHGTLPTGEFVEVHETMLPPGKMPHPPHRHRNTEFVLIRQGSLEFLNNGVSQSAGAGDVIYTVSNQLHGLRNVGDTAALYFIVSVSHP